MMVKGFTFRLRSLPFPAWEAYPVYVYVTRRHTQFSVLRPATRPKCFALFVTNMIPNDSAWAAMRVSKVPMGAPR